MPNLKSVEIKAFVPAKDFEISTKFYCDLGFEKKSEGGGVAYFCHGSCSFLLQDFYVKEMADNLMMHLLVEDVYSWYDHVKEAKLVEKYNLKITEIMQQPWRMADFVLMDPAGVAWRIGQNTD